jgi:HK97 family phage major capsid protein
MEAHQQRFMAQLQESRREHQIARQRLLTKVAEGRSLTEDESRSLDEHTSAVEMIGTQIQAEIRQAKEDAEYREAWQSSFKGLNARAVSGRSEQDEEYTEQFRSAILSRNPAPIDIRMDASARSYYQPGLERRDLLKTTATQALPSTAYSKIVDHLVEQSAVLRAGATLVSTETGLDLLVPKSTAFSTSAIVAEGQPIGESDPTLAVVTLKAYKYAVLFQISHELANDGNVDLLAFMQRQAGVSLALKFGDDLINGDGSSKPRGILTDAATGVTGPTGTATTLGAQQTVGQGSDLLYSLYGSLAEPYVIGGTTGWLMRNATKTKIASLKSSAGDPIGWPEDLGPAYVDPFVPAMGANAKSIIFGDMSRYFVRIAEGVRFERDDSVGFASDLITFRAIVRLDAALVDANAIKVFANSAT